MEYARDRALLICLQIVYGLIRHASRITKAKKRYQQKEMERAGRIKLVKRALPCLFAFSRYINGQAHRVELFARSLG